jgi:hypothetical protein
MQGHSDFHTLARPTTATAWLHPVILWGCGPHLWQNTNKGALIRVHVTEAHQKKGILTEQSRVIHLEAIDYIFDQIHVLQEKRKERIPIVQIFSTNKPINVSTRHVRINLF